MASAFDVEDGSAGFGARLTSCIDALAGLVGEIEADRFTGADAVALTVLFARGERLCATGKAMTAKRVEDTGAWESSGARSAAAWLARVSGQSTGRAAGALGTARRIRRQPDVEDAARRGELSDEQSRAVTAAADKDPSAAPALLAQAGCDSVEALREKAREVSLAADRAEEEKARARRIHASRFLRWWTDDEGAGRISGRFTPEALAAIEAAIRPFHEEAFDTARRAGRRERRECLAADALVAMAHAASSPDHPGTCDDDCDPDCPHGSERREGPTRSAGPGWSDGPSGSDRPDRDGAPRPGGSGPRPGDDDGRRPQDRPRRESRLRGPTRGQRRGRAAATIIVRVDHAALVRGWRQAGECCEIDGIGPVPVATVQAMMTDAFLAAVVTDGMDIRSVVHLGRAATAHQVTALLARDSECVVPGCHIRRGLEIDHVTGWTATRTTTVDDLARLCRHHHRQKTYEGATLTGPPGRWRWTPPTSAVTDEQSRPDRRARPTGHPTTWATPPPPGRDPPPSPTLFDPGEEPFPP